MFQSFQFNVQYSLIVCGVFRFKTVNKHSWQCVVSNRGSGTLLYEDVKIERERHIFNLSSKWWMQELKNSNRKKNIYRERA